MATGDLTVFQGYQLDAGNKVHNHDADVFKMLLVNNGVGAPTAGDATPRLADYVANEVATTGGYPANGMVIGNPTFTIAGGVATFDDDGTNLSLLQDAGGFTDAWWGIIYNDTATGDEAVAFIELGGPVSEVAGPITINFNALGILTKTIV